MPIPLKKKKTLLWKRMELSHPPLLTQKKPYKNPFEKEKEKES
jgi:hypothetical protein